MGTPTTILKLVVIAGLATAMSGCKFFDIGNPLLPKARYLGTPEPSMIKVEYNYMISTKTIEATAPDAKFKVFSYPGDTAPGVFWHSYSAEYFDMNGRPIPTLFLAKANFGISQYSPPAGNGQQSTIQIDLPVYNQQVRLYGDTLAYSDAGSVISLNPNFSHTINAGVTLYGEDDNYNQVEVRFNVPIQFIAKISN